MTNLFDASKSIHYSSDVTVTRLTVCMVLNVSKYNDSFSPCDLKGLNADSAPKSMIASLKIVQ